MIQFILMLNGKQLAVSHPHPEELMDVRKWEQVDVRMTPTDRALRHTEMTLQVNKMPEPDGDPA